MFGSLGVMEIGIIAAIALLIFGPRQLPKLGRSLGDTIRELRGIGRELRDEVPDDADDDSRPRAPAPDASPKRDR